METHESSPTKHRRYDLSMSKRTRKPNNAMVAAEVNPGEDGELVCAPPVNSKEKKEGVAVQQVLDCTSDKALVKETIFAPTTPRPSLKELIQVTNKEERDAREVTEQDLVREKVCEREREDKLLSGVVRQHQIVTVTGRKPVPGMVQRCTKALNQMIKVRYAVPKQKNAVALIGM